MTATVNMYDCLLLLVGWLLSTQHFANWLRLRPLLECGGLQRQARQPKKWERSLGWQVGCEFCSKILVHNLITYTRQLWRMREFRVRRTVGLVRTIKCFARSHQRAAEIWETSTTNSWQNSLSAHSSRDIEQPFFPNTQFRNYFSRFFSSHFWLWVYASNSHSILINFHENLNSSSNKWMKWRKQQQPKNDIGVRRARVHRTKKLFIRKKSIHSVCAFHNNLEIFV